jgi:lipoate-protein ligase A
MNWRFVDLGPVDAFYGPAAFEAIMDARSKDLVLDTILFWRPEKPAIYVGYHQLVNEDINTEACRAAGVHVIRRTLGGGTGYCDRNQIIYNVIFKESASDLPPGPKGVYGKVLGGVINALNSLGIEDACVDPERFSVYANGKKISGSGQLTSNGVVNSSGSFLVDFDCSEMSKYLKDPVKNLREGVMRPEDGITSLRREIGKTSLEEAAIALMAGFEKSLGPVKPGILTDLERSCSSALLTKYISPEWTFRADQRIEKRRKGLIKLL